MNFLIYRRFLAGKMPKISENGTFDALLLTFGSLKLTVKRDSHGSRIHALYSTIKDASLNPHFPRK